MEKRMLVVPSQKASVATEVRCGKVEDFACAVKAVDRECRRLGYQRIVTQRRNGEQFVCVPALVRNCSSLLTLLAAGGNIGPGHPRPEPANRPQPRATTASSESAGALSDISCATAAGSTSGINSSHRIKSSHRGGWKRIFSRKWLPSKAAAANKNSATDAAAADVPGSPMPEDESVWHRTQDSAPCLQQLLEEVRHDTERLTALAGLAIDEETHATAQPLTQPQREVLYFQTRWPQIVDAIGIKLTEAGREAERTKEEATARAKAASGARTRSIAKMANMEAELRRLRTELHRWGQPIKPPPSRATFQLTQTRRLQLKLQQQSKKCSQAAPRAEVATAAAAMEPSAAAGDAAASAEFDGTQ